LLLNAKPPFSGMIEPDNKIHVHMAVLNKFTELGSPNTQAVT